MQHLTRVIAALMLVGMLGSASAQLKTGEHPEANPIWIKVKASLFAGRAIQAAPDGVVSIDAPMRAEDAAIVPLAVHTQLAAGDARRVTRLYLIIDNNPSPIAAIFDFAPSARPADMETRVRIDEYTHVRAIAELSDGELLMALRFIKASGGCSAPPGKDPQAALASLGKMRLRVEGAVRGGQPALVQLMISHPNDSGLAMDQLTRQYTPSHFVREVKVSYGGEPVLSADVDISISENPNFRFYFVPQGDGVLKAEVTDSHGLVFEKSIALTPDPAL